MQFHLIEIIRFLLQIQILGDKDLHFELDLGFVAIWFNNHVIVQALGTIHLVKNFVIFFIIQSIILKNDAITLWYQPESYLIIKWY